MASAAACAGQLPALVASAARRWPRGLLRAVLVLTALGVAGLPAALLRAGTPVARAATTYTITDLGTLPLLRASSAAAGINASGQVVGAADSASGGQHAFLSQNGQMTDLGTLPGSSASFAN